MVVNLNMLHGIYKYKIRLIVYFNSAYCIFTIMNIKNYLWLLPFCSFILGYGIIQWFFNINSMPTPHLVGCYAHEILTLLSEKKLNLRVINQKEESNIPAVIIISQMPQ